MRDRSSTFLGSRSAFASGEGQGVRRPGSQCTKSKNSENSLAFGIFPITSLSWEVSWGKVEVNWVAGAAGLRVFSRKINNLPGV